MKKVYKDIRAGLAATIIVALIFLVAEPTIIRSATAEDQHTITQTITSEISFLVAANDVTMNGSIGGLTGGTSHGTTTVVVSTNDVSGFTMTITASSSPAMQGDNLATNINDYTPASAGVPDFAFVAPVSGAEFGYSVSASTTSHLAQKFLDDGASTCNTGSADTSGSASCWYGLSTTATSTVVTTSATTGSGATSSVYYRVAVAANSGLEEGTYTATTTLTATTN